MKHKGIRPENTGLQYEKSRSQKNYRYITSIRVVR